MDNGPNFAEIRVRAYFIWLESGCKPGRDIQNWSQAEKEIRHEHALKHPELPTEIWCIILEMAELEFCPINKHLYAIQYCIFERKYNHIRIPSLIRRFRRILTSMAKKENRPPPLKKILFSKIYNASRLTNDNKVIMQTKIYRIFWNQNNSTVIFSRHNSYIVHATKRCGMIKGDGKNYRGLMYDDKLVAIGLFSRPTKTCGMKLIGGVQMTMSDSMESILIEICHKGKLSLSYDLWPNGTMKPLFNDNKSGAIDFIKHRGFWVPIKRCYIPSFRTMKEFTKLFIGRDESEVRHRSLQKRDEIFENALKNPKEFSMINDVVEMIFNSQ